MTLPAETDDPSSHALGGEAAGWGLDGMVVDVWIVDCLRDNKGLNRIIPSHAQFPTEMTLDEASLENRNGGDDESFSPESKPKRTILTQAMSHELQEIFRTRRRRSRCRKSLKVDMPAVDVGMVQGLEVGLIGEPTLDEPSVTGIGPILDP